MNPHRIFKRHFASPDANGEQGWNFHGYCTIHQPSQRTGWNKPGTSNSRESAGQRHFHLLEAVAFQQTLKEIWHALTGGETHAAQTPACDIAEAHGATSARNLIGRGSAGECRGYNRAGSDSSNAMNQIMQACEQLADRKTSRPGRPSFQRTQNVRWLAAQCT